MNAVGVVVEYNPFHNGHRYHLEQSRRRSGADVVVAVMSGHFLQRGEPALTDKWIRTQMALAGGADLVLELPFAFACNSAPHFAHGAIESLAALGGVSHLCFGSEAGDLANLQEGGAFLRQHAQAIQRGTQDRLRQGDSYPLARQKVVEALGGEGLTALLSKPNNILGLEYLQALHASDCAVAPVTVERIGVGYHELSACGEIASATGIRHRLSQGFAVDGLVPSATAELIGVAEQDGALVEPARLETALLMALQKSEVELSLGYQVPDGVGKRMAEAARWASGLEELIDFLKSRQLTQTRVQRMLIYQLMGARNEEMTQMVKQGPQYLRLLGVNERGQAFLGAHRKQRKLPLLTNLSRAYSQLNRHYGTGATTAHEMFELDLKATRVFGLLQKRAPAGALNRDFYQDVIRPHASAGSQPLSIT